MPTVFHERKRKDYYFIKRALPRYGSSFYLPSKHYSGEGFSEVVNWAINNAGPIKDISSALGNTVSTIGKTTSDTIRAIQDLKRLQQLKAVPPLPPTPAITESAAEKILSALPKTGTGFKIIS